MEQIIRTAPDSEGQNIVFCGYDEDFVTWAALLKKGWGFGLPFFAAAQEEHLATKKNGLRLVGTGPTQKDAIRQAIRLAKIYDEAQGE